MEDALQAESSHCWHLSVLTPEHFTTSSWVPLTTCRGCLNYTCRKALDALVSSWSSDHPLIPPHVMALASRPGHLLSFAIISLA